MKHNFLDGILITSVLFCEIFENKLYLILMPLLFIRYFFSERLHDNKFIIPTSVFWLLALLFFTTFHGIRIPSALNSDNFSILYNTLFFLVLIGVSFIIDRYKEKYYLLIESVLFLSIIFIAIPIFYLERGMIFSKWSEFILGTTGYRLGISIGVNPNTLAWVFGELAMLSMYITFISKQKIKYLLFFIVFFCLVLFTGSKNGFILSIIPLVYFGLKAVFRLNVKTAVLSIFGLILFIIVVWNTPVLYTLIGRRFESMLQTLNIIQKPGIQIDSSSTGKRLLMFRDGLRMFLGRPVSGWGIGWFALKSGYNNYSHNNYIELLVSGGLPFFVIYYSVPIYCFIKALISKNSIHRDLILILLIGKAIIDFGTVNFYLNITLYLVAILAIHTSAFLNKTGELYES